MVAPVKNFAPLDQPVGRARFVRRTPSQKQTNTPNSPLRYKRARYYHAQLGRFISRDPLGYVDGMSLYRAYFVPSRTDPTGLRIQDSCGPGSPLFPGCLFIDPPAPKPPCEPSVSLSLNPDSPEKAPWHESKLKAADGILWGTTRMRDDRAEGGKFPVKCWCEECNDCGVFCIKCALNYESFILLNRANFAKSHPGTPFEMAYGHEQRHVENDIEFFKILQKTTSIQLKRDYPCTNSGGLSEFLCDASARNVEERIHKMIMMHSIFSHSHIHLTPRENTPYPMIPAGGQLPNETDPIPDWVFANQGNE